MDTPDLTITRDQPQMVLAIFADRPRAESAIQTLRQQGFTDDQLSVLVRHDETNVTADELAAMDRDAERTGTDVAVGGTMGGLAGLLGGLALSAVPGIGPFLGAGVLATTFGGAAIGSALGERWAHFHTLGVPQERAPRYGSALETGQIVLSVSARGADDVMRAREVLALQQADEIDVYPQMNAA